MLQMNTHVSCFSHRHFITQRTVAASVTFAVAAAPLYLQNLLQILRLPPPKTNEYELSYYQHTVFMESLVI